MDKPRFMLDSNIIIGHLNNQIDLFSFFEVHGECEVFFNLVTEIEALAKPGMNANEETETRAVLDCFKRVEIDKPVRDIAILIRRAKELLLPDALIAASAITLNATVLSNDQHLLDFQRSGYTAMPVSNEEYGAVRREELGGRS